ncbi:MAG: CBS domain-containing protein [Planctomycetota bacterium]
MISSTTSQEVQQWMSRDVQTANEIDSIQYALTRMADEKISALPVIDDQDHLLGIVTVGDVARRVLVTERLLETEYPHYEDCFWAVDLIQKNLGSDQVTALMSEVLTTISPEQTMAAAAKVMKNNHVRHLPVVTSHGKLVGMLSANDFVRLAAKAA